MSANKWGFPERVGACGLHGVLIVSASPGSLPSSGSTVGSLWVHLREWEAQVAVDRSHRESDGGMKPQSAHTSVTCQWRRIRWLAAIRRWGQLQPPINDSSTGSQMEIFVDVFDQMFPLHRLDSSWTKQWARSVEGKRWCAWFISQDKTRALDWLLMQNSLSRLHCVSNSWKPNL